MGVIVIVEVVQMRKMDVIVIVEVAKMRKWM